MNATKVSHVSIAGALAAIAAWSLNEFAGVHLPPGLESAAAVLFTVLVAAIVPSDLLERVRG